MTPRTVTATIPGRRRNKRPEKALEKSIVAFLEVHRWVVTPLNAGKMFKGKYKVELAPTGTSDLICCSPTGRYVAIEVKAPGKLSGATDAQKAFLFRVNENHGLGMVVDSMGPIEALVLRFRQESKDYPYDQDIPTTAPGLRRAVIIAEQNGDRNTASDLRRELKKGEAA